MLTSADGYLMAKSDNMFPLTYTCIYCQHEAEYLESQIFSIRLFLFINLEIIRVHLLDTHPIPTCTVGVIRYFIA